MRKIIAVVLLLASFNMIYAQKESEEKPLKNDFGILEWFIDTPLSLNRLYTSSSTYINVGYEAELHIKREGSKLIISEGSFVWELHKTKDVGKFKAKIPYVKVSSARKLNDGSIEILYQYKSLGNNVERKLITVPGLGLKIFRETLYLSHNKTYTRNEYYVSEENHLSSGDNNENLNNPIIFALGETRYVANRNLQFVAAKDSKIQLMAENTKADGSASLILYDSTGKIVQEVDGGGVLKINYTVPEDGVYYISTLIHNDGTVLLSLIEG